VKSLLTLWFLCSALTAAPPEGYYQSAKGLRGTELREALHDIIDDHTIIKYSKTREAMALLHEDPRNSKKLIQIYTQRSVAKKDTEKWNREHLWPRARGNTDKRGPDDSDLHHLFPSDYDVNAERASLLYDITSPPRLSSRWSMDNDSFQPPAKVTGDIARALFYMAVRYDGSDRQTSNLTLVSKDFHGAEMGHLKTLIKWHLADPPDAFERRRNDLIFEKFQHNRNPFIDFPELVSAIWMTTDLEGFAPEKNNDTLELPCKKSSSSPSSPSSLVVPTEPSETLEQPKNQPPSSQPQRRSSPNPSPS
jgi:endonuclease I